MVHAKVEIKPDIELSGAGVEVTHDFSAGNNSGGGVGVITEIVEHLSHVRYIIDEHTEKYIPITRLTMIPMPFRRDKAQLRTRSMQLSVENTGFKILLTSQNKFKKMS